MLAVGGCVLAFWGKWPAWKSLAVDNRMEILGLMQLIAQKTGLLVDVLTVELGLLVVFFGRRYGAGWRSHAQQIVIGLSTASIAQLAIQAIWQTIAKTAAPHSMAEYQRVVGLREKLFNANSGVYLVVLIWWIVCLWIDEPGSSSAAAEIPSREIAPGDEPPLPELPSDTEN
jgi:hypothetical protein